MSTGPGLDASEENAEGIPKESDGVPVAKFRGSHDIRVPFFPMRSTLRILATFAAVATCLPISVAPRAAAATAPQVFDSKPGPWGRVQWHYIHLEAPDWIVEYFSAPHTQPTWVFPKADAATLVNLLVEAGVGRETMDRWFADKRVLTKGPNPITIFPAPADVEALSERTRVRIYSELAKHPQNEYHANPVKILDRDVDAWLGRKVIRPEIRALLKKLVYSNGSVLCFSDVAVLLGHAQNREEVAQFMKLMTRIRAVMAYVQIGEQDDTRTLDRYWSAGYRRKDVLPMLNSISLLPGGGRIGFSHLLPAEARKLMYTYPTLAMAARGRMPDCHWTALNFFQHNPQNVFLDLRLVATQMLEGYELVEPPYEYGDVLVFLDKEGKGQHSCVYLCDELVFTKNGELASAPWLVSTLTDVRRIYSELGPGAMRVFRRKWTDEE